MTSPRAFRARVVGSDGIAGVETEVEVSARGVRVDRIVRRARDGDDGGGREARDVGEIPVVERRERARGRGRARGGGDGGDGWAVEGDRWRARRGRRAGAGASGAGFRRRWIASEIGGGVVGDGGGIGVGDGGGIGVDGDGAARDLGENLLLSDALRAAEEALAAARSKASEGEDYFDNSTVSYEIKVRNLTKNLEFQERAWRSCGGCGGTARKDRALSALEEVLGKENEALRKDLKETREERDRSLRRAEASEIMAAHAKNEVGRWRATSFEPEIYDENIELKREIAIANSARATTDEHLKVTLAHLRAARKKTFEITEELLKKTEEHLDTSRVWPSSNR